MTIDPQTLIQSMEETLLTDLAGQSAKVIAFAAAQASRLATAIAVTAEQYVLGNLTGEEAMALLQMDVTSAKTALLAAEGFGALLAEQIPNDFLSAVRDTVNTLIGFKLI